MGCTSSKPAGGDDFKSVSPSANPNAAKEDTIKIALKNKRQNRANVFNAGMVCNHYLFHHLLTH